MIARRRSSVVASLLAALLAIPLVPATPAAAAETPTVEVTSSANPSTYGDPVTFTATVTGPSATPTGTVAFLDGTTELATAPLNSGAATYVTSALGAGNHSITVAYGGDGTYDPADSPVVVQVVSKKTLTVTPDAQSLGYGAPVPAYTFSVTGWVPGEGPGTADGYVSPTCTSAYTNTTPVSSSPLTISCSGGSADNYVLDTSATASLTISKADQATLTITGPASRTFGDAPFTPTTSGGSTGGAVTFTSSTPTVCTASASATVTIVKAGTCTITAMMAGDADYEPATSAPFDVTISKATQATLAITGPASATFGAPDATITTTGGSGTGDVTFDAGSSTACSIVAGKLHVLSGTGPCSITATKAGDANYGPTTSARYDIAVNRAAQATLSITGPTSKTYGDAPFTPVTDGGSGTGAETFTSTTPTVCTASATATVTIVGAGTCTVTATKAADANYNATTSAPFNIGISRAAQATLAITGPASATFGAPDATITTTGGSGTGDLTFDAGSSTACSIVAGKLHVLSGTGPCSITATKAGDANYGPATSAPFNVTINKAVQAPLSITAPTSKTYGDAPFTPTTSGGSTGGTVTFTSSTPAVCTASDSPSVTIVGAGPCSITATMAGSADYLSVTSAAFTVTVSLRAITVTADAKTKVYGDADPALTYQVTPALLGGDTLAGSLSRVAGENVGTRAIQQGTLSGGGNYAITFVGANLTISKATLTVTADNKTKTYGDANPALTASYSGFKFSETLGTSGVTGSPALSTTATSSSTVGTYPITVTTGTLAASNYAFSTAAGTLTVTTRTLTVTASSHAVTYGDLSPAVSANYSGWASLPAQNPNTLTTKPTCTTDYDQFDPAGAPYVTTCSGGVDDNYDFAYVAGTVTVAKRALGVTADAKSRTYGAADPAFTFTYGTFVGTDGAGDIDTPPTCTTTATATSPVATYPITCSGGVDGNYALTYTGASLSVTKAPLTVTGDDKSRTYGAANPAFTATLSGFVNGQTLGTSGVTGAAACTTTATTTSPVATYPITCTAGTLAATNYAFTTFAPGTLTIGAAALSITANDATRAYGDANPAFTVAYAGFVAGDDAADLDTPPTCTTTATTSTPVGTAAITCAGAADANYAITHHPGTLTITRRALAVTATGVNKVYDGTTAATVTLGDNRVAGDTLTTSYTSATFASASAGTNKAVSVGGITVTGTDAGNYTWNTTTTTTANITQASVTASITAADKVYDGTATASATCALGGVLAADTANVTCAGTATFADRNVGTAKTVTMTGITLAGTASGNYSLSSTTDTDTADITARSLTVTATGTNKVYDGTTAATVTLAGNSLAGDSVTLAYIGATFANKNVGTGKAVNVTGISVSGVDAGNYALANTTATTSANITARTLTVTATGVDRVYDGTTAATVTLAGNTVLADVVTLGYTGASFASKTVGTGKAVSVTGISITGGTDAANYSLGSTTAATTADITARPLTVTATGTNKVYDGTTAATVTLASDKVAADAVNLAYSGATFGNKNVGTAKTVDVAGISISGGADAGNYTLVNATATATANITARTLTVTATGVNKVYDGTTAATVTLAGNTVLADVVTLAYTSAAFASSAAGTGRAVSVTGISITGGADAGNYSLGNTTAAATATITQRAVTPAVATPDKVYDATTVAPGSTCSLAGVLAADTANVTCTGTAAFADKHVGNGKTVTMTGITLAGTASGNYAPATTTAATTADITARSLTVTATGVNKVYDGTTSATVTLASNQVAGDSVTLGYTTAAFLDETVGTGKFVAVAGISISGTDATNYALQNTTEETAASITRRTLTVTATASNKVYDGTTPASITLGDDRVAGDSLTVSHTSATFATKHVGAGKTVTVSGLGIGGTDAGNYQLAATSTTATANITARPITVTAAASTKVYDGTTASSGVPAITAGSLATGDTATWTQTFDTKAAGSGKTLTPAGTVADGNAGNNYAVTFASSTTGRIDPKGLTVSGITSPGKVYDGGTTAPLNLGSAALVGRVGTDAVTLVTTGATGSFADKNVGTGKTVTVAGLAISGADAGNYALAQPTTTASITKATATVTPAAVSRTYGAANPTLAYTFAGLVVGETLATSGITGEATCSTTATTTSGVGPYPITCATNPGNPLAATNYQFGFTPGTLTVTPAPLTVTADARAREYGLPNPALTATVSGFVNGDDATSAQLTGAAACTTTAIQASNVGTYPITCTRGTLAAPNYEFPPPKLVDGTLLVTQALAAPAVASSANPAVASQEVTFTATVSWPPTGTPGPAPTGTVTFFEEGTDVSGPVDLVDGVAAFTTSWPEAGDEDLHAITAVYSGDGGNFGQAASASFNQVVGKSAVEVVLTDAPVKWETNVPVTFTADVHPLASGVTVPVAGTVAFRVDGVLKATVAVVAGKAAYTTKLALGTRSVTATFTPDPSVASVFKAGASAPLARTVVTNTISASGVGVSSSSVYPVTDTWRDTVAIRGTRNERISVAISIYAPTGTRVRSASISTGSGAYSYTWNGRSSSGTILAAGKYKVVQRLRDVYGAERTYTSYVTLSKLRMYWYTKTISVSPGPRNYQVRSTANTDPTKGPSLSSPSTTSTGALVMENRAEGALAWLAAGYQFTLPSASTYSWARLEVFGSWSGTTAPKVGLIPWKSGDWGSIYDKARLRTAMGATSGSQAVTNLTGIRSGRYIRAAIDSFEGPSGYSAGAYRYWITNVRLVVKYGILK